MEQNTHEVTESSENAFNQWHNFERNISLNFLQGSLVVFFSALFGTIVKQCLQREFCSPFVISITTLGLAGFFLLLSFMYRRAYSWSVTLVSLAGAMLYITPVFLFSISHVISLEYLLGLWAGVSIIFFYIAHHYKSLPLLVLTGLVAYAMPLVIKDQLVTTPAILSFYLLAFSAMGALITYTKNIDLLFITSACATIAYGSYYSLWSSWWFVALFWIFYVAIPYLFVLSGRTSSVLEAIAMFSSALATSWWTWQFITQKALVEQITLMVAGITQSVNFVCLVTLSFLLIYMVMLLFLKIIRRHEDYTFKILYTLSVIHALIALVCSISGWRQIAILSSLSFVLWYASFALRASFMRSVSYALWAYGVVYALWLALFKHYAIEHIFGNTINIAVLVTIATLASALLTLNTYPNRQAFWERYSREFLEGLAYVISITWFFTGVWSMPYRIIGLLAMSAAWLTYGLYTKRTLMRYSSYALFAASTLYAIRTYLLYAAHPQYAVQLHILCLGSLIVYLISFFLMQWTAPWHSKRENVIAAQSFLCMVIISLFVWLRALVIINFDTIQHAGSFFTQRLMGYSKYDDTFKRTQLTDWLLVFLYAFYAMLVTGYGLWRDNRVVRMLGFGFACIAGLKIMMMVISVQLGG